MVINYANKVILWNNRCTGISNLNFQLESLWNKGRLYIMAPSENMSSILCPPSGY